MSEKAIPSTLVQATFGVTEADLPAMLLARDQLPSGLRSFAVLREGVLDNRTMAEQGFSGNTEESLRAIGRITGYLREFGNPSPGSEIPDGTDLAAATVAHLFDDDQGVSRWITDIFLRQFEENAGRIVAAGQELVSADRMDAEGFADEAVALRALQRGPMGLVSSTVVDFRVGRILGVAYVVTLGDHVRQDLVEPMGRELEKQIVRVVLGAS